MVSRRNFIGRTVKAGLAVSLYPQFAEESRVAAEKKKQAYDAKGLPVALLGKTGVAIPRIAFGLGSRYLTIKSQDEAIELITYALDNGLYYWDTANSYVNNETGAVSEERLGLVVEKRRGEIFLSTKIASRNRDEAMKQVEQSLKRLRTDRLDMLKLHSVENDADADRILAKGGVLDMISELKMQGVTRFIGFSGHSSASALTKLASTGRFDSMLFAMNHYGNGAEERQGSLIPVARKNGMGVMIMKSVRPKEAIAGLNPSELVRFALSLEGPAGVVVGMESRKVVDSNLQLLRNFRPMEKAEIDKYAAVLFPWYNGGSAPWLQPGYSDGQVSA